MGKSIKYDEFVSRITEEELIDYYINTNHSVPECLEYFNTTYRVFNKYLSKHNIKKPRHLANKLSKKTKLERYGDENYNNLEKCRQTCIKKYDSTSPLGCKDIWQKTFDTTIEKHGGTGFQAFSKEKRIEVSKKANSSYYNKYYNDEEFRNNCLSKQIETKRKNKSFNTSSRENELYEYLVSIYGKDNVKPQYDKDPRYPFLCDFYIPSEDLFIELNLHWTHGYMPYNPDDIKCQKQLEKWQEKAKTIDYYNNAIDTWTIRDVKKIKMA